MPAAQLASNVQVTALASGASVTLPHGIRRADIGPTTPNIVMPNTDTPIRVVSVNNTNIVFQNGGAETESALFYVELTHTIQEDPVALEYWQGSVAGQGAATYCFEEAATAINVYVDGTNGSNSNDGLTPTTALLTIQGVYAKFPLFAYCGCRININLAGVGGFGASATGVLTYTCRTIQVGGGESINNSYCYIGPQMVPFTPATGASTAALDAVNPTLRVDLTNAANAAGNRTQFNFTTAAPGWTVSNLRGRFLRVTRAGVKVLFEIPISENDADQIYVDVAIANGTILSTDTVTIVEQGANITGGSTLDNINNVRIVGDGAPLFAVQNAGQSKHYTFERIQYTGGVASFGNGLGFDRCGFSTSTRFVGHNTQFINCSVRGLLGVTGSVVTGPPPPLDGAGNPANPTTLLMEIQSVASSGILVGSPATGGPCTWVFSRNVSSYASTVGCRVYGGSVLFADTNNNPALQGKSNTGVGLRVRWNATAALRANGGAAPPPNTNITGTGGDLQVDTGAAVAYGNGAGQWEEAAGFNGNFTRVLEGASAAAPTGDASRICIAAAL